MTMGASKPHNMSGPGSARGVSSLPNLKTYMLFWHHTGPLLKYERGTHNDGTLHVEDLNPQIKTKWRVSRTEMFKLGARCIWAALRG
jgi:hypothetical protein